MKKIMRKTAVVWVSLVMMMALTACGSSGVDTKESVQETVDQLQEKMATAMSGYQDVFNNNDNNSEKDPAKSAERIEKSLELIDAGIEACESVDAEGPDSQRYCAVCRDLFQLMKDMMLDIQGADPSNPNAGLEISQKYLGQMMSLATQASQIGQELVTKYGITLPTTAPSATPAA